MEVRLYARPVLAELFQNLGYDAIGVRSDWKGERPLTAHDERLDALVVLPRSIRATLGSRRIRARRRIGYPGVLRERLWDRVVAMPPRLQEHQVDRYLRLLAPSLDILELPSGEVTTTPRLALAETPPLPDLPGKFAVLAPGAAYGPAKRWDPARFADLGRGLEEPVVILGAGPERETCREVASAVGDGAIDLGGQTTLSQAAAILSRASVVVANDSGLMHLAAALGAPTVGLFGATDPEATGPRGEVTTVLRGNAPCSPCRHRRCPRGRICWNDLQVEAVTASALSVRAGRGEA